MRFNRLSPLVAIATPALLAGLLLPAVSRPAFAQGKSEFHVPDTSVEAPEDRGERAHTNHRILLNPDGGLGPNGGMTPAQVRSFYNMPSTATGSGTIAIVIAFHYPTAVNDFNVFSAAFGLPKETGTGSVFQVVYATNGNKKPRTNGGWAQEAALDIEWSHAMAPNAKIILVEAASNSYADLFKAVDKAKTLGASQISMSWGGNEFSGETAYDSHFASSSIVFLASSGDNGGVMSYPAASPNVVAVGGTSVATDSSGAFVGETGWSGSGGGVSAYEPAPSYQSSLGLSRRGVPDISADADPYTGVCVYDSTSYQGFSGWMVFGGTSVSAPCMAGMVNAAGHNGRSTADELTMIYQHLGGSDYRDITSGTAGAFSCTTGWDKVTGVGSPIGIGGL